MNSQDQITVDITARSSGGDGVAEVHIDDALMRVTVPYTVLGDVVKIALNHDQKGKLYAELVEIITPSPDRIEPSCIHFGQCGGCRLQHVSEQRYYEIKNEALKAIIGDLGCDPGEVMMPMVMIGPSSRRRVEFKVRCIKGQIDIGFFAARSHDLVPIEVCPVSDDHLVHAIPELKLLIERLKNPGHITALSVTLLEEGLDVVLVTNRPLKHSDRQICDHAVRDMHTSIVRLSEYVRPVGASHQPIAENDNLHVIYDRGNAYTRFDGLEVPLPVGAFLQATATGQDEITRLVTGGLNECRKIADLFSGCGTYSLPLAKNNTHVTAFEVDETMVMALHNAIITHQLDSYMSAYSRDLFTHPLKEHELGNYDGVVLNPPRDGALAQVKMLSKRQVSRIVMVSCNPKTFQRDAKILIDGGYTLRQITPIDQFYWSPHLELVAWFEI